MDETVRKKYANPIETANICSKIFFCWLNPFFLKGYKKTLDVDDLYDVPKEDSSEYLGNKLEKQWRKEIDSNQRPGRAPKLMCAVWKTFGLQFMMMGILCCLEECAVKIGQPLFLGALIRYFQPGSGVTLMEAYLYATGLSATAALFTFTHHPYFFGVLRTGMKIRVACCSMIYRKALRLSHSALGQTTIGQMVNLLSNDVNRFDMSVIFLHYLWVGPLQVAITLSILWRQLGWACVIGISYLILLMPLQSYMGKLFGKLRLKTARLTDERIRITNEIVSGMQVIKMYSWEAAFAKLVHEARKKEVRILRQTSFAKAFNMSVFYVSSKVILLLTFGSYVLMNDEALSADKVFVTVALYNNIRLVMTLFFPTGISQLAETLVSFKRLQKFLLLEEKETNSTVLKSNLPMRTDSCSLTVDKITAHWQLDNEKPTLNNISVTVNSGELLVIVGPVGAGKTSLMMALLGELPTEMGSIKIQGSIAYASQEPWAFQASVRHNIVFGQAFDERKYKKVLSACALEKDIEAMPYGDKTLVGERGVSLSGGQRARVNLARALYADAQIYLLDDPLSAVDANVGRHLFNKCINGYLRNKIRILVTHQMQYVKLADKILVLREGECVAQGTFHQVMNAGLDLASIIDEGQPKTPVKTFSSPQWVRSTSVLSHTSSASSILAQIEDDFPPADEVQTVEAEGTGSGRVQAKVYWKYVRSGASFCFMLFLLTASIICQILYSGSEYWLTQWTNMEERKSIMPNNETMSSSISFLSHVDTNTYMYVYAGLVGGLFVMAQVRAATFFYICMQASVKLHNRMFNSLIRTSLSFFNANPSGRILNRFSRDLGIIDERLPECLNDCIEIGFTVIGILILVLMVNFWLVFPAVVLGIVLYYLRRFYLETARDVKRLEGTTRSPVFSHLSASLHGLSTIRAFGVEETFHHEFDKHQDLHSAAWFLFISTTRWFGIFLDWMCIIFITVVTYSLLLISDNIMGGDVGLAITSTILLAGMFQWGVRQSAELESQMTSVERVLEYSDLKPESGLEKSPDKPIPPNWPQHGIITFEGVYLTYGDNEVPVLKNLYCCIRASEKVGIVGRTGAGKSSMIVALFRLTEPEGVIRIDAINIQEIGLHLLRRNISIIPQDPVLFTGTMRRNLDPFGDHSDESLWSSLEDVQLRQAVKELSGGLDTELTEGGSNFSVGQRQLVCLARAILRKNKILVLDEATANIDNETDQLIQNTIRRKFKECTVLTIAHRLHTIMDSDRVMVLDAGRIVEFDEPYTLMQDEKSHLQAMVQKIGSEASGQLMAVAREAYLSRTAKNELDGCGGTTPNDTSQLAVAYPISNGLMPMESTDFQENENNIIEESRL